MSLKLIISAAASTLAMAALAIGAPGVRHSAHDGASLSPAIAGVPAPSVTLPFFLPR